MTTVKQLDRTLQNQTDPEVTFTEINIGMLKTYIYTKACTQVFTVPSFTILKKLEVTTIASHG